MAIKKYDAAVIGAGSAGIVAATMLAKHGKKTALIEKRDIGGECLNSGCISSKILLKTAHLSQKIKNAAQLGISCSIEKPRLSDVMKAVSKTAFEITEQYRDKIKAEKNIDFIEAQASFLDKNTLKAGDIEIKADKIIISSGSSAFIPEIEGLKETGFLTSCSVFSAKNLPNRLAVLGSGSIGLELGQSFLNLGSEVFIIDRSAGPFHREDAEIGPLIKSKLEEEGMKFIPFASVKKVSRKNGKKIITLEIKGETKDLEVDEILAATGRKPNTFSLNLKSAGIETNERGFIKTNSYLETSVKNIYAAGDCAGPYLFAHMAVYQAKLAAENILYGNKKETDYSAVPWTTYTSPEVAHVGLNENEAKEKSVFFRSHIIDLKNIDRAVSEKDTKGFLKLILGEKDKILGVTIVSEKAGEMIGMGVLSLKKNFSADNFGGLILPYPTVSEIYTFAAEK
ncbi:MAG: FAD-dependent oxidoreductase [Elusimicrobiota bacterium]